MAIPETKYNRSKKVFSDTSIALSCGRLWPRLLQSLAQSQTGSPNTLVLLILKVKISKVSRLVPNGFICEMAFFGI